MNTIEIGIIGTGWVAGAHAAALGKIPGVKVVAVCSGSLDRARAALKTWNLPPEAKAYDKLDHMLKQPGLSAVSICTAHPDHPASTIAAAKAGKHIIIEKPVALNQKDLTAMLQAVNDAGVMTSVCFELRYMGLFRNIKAMLQQNLIGQVFYGEASYFHGIGPWYRQHSWNIKKEIAGDAVLTAGCHALDSLLWLMDDRVVEVAAMSNTSPNNPLGYEYDPNSVAILRFARGAIAKVATSIECRQPYLFPVLLQGEKGSIYNDKVSTLDWPGTTHGQWATVPAALPDSGDVDDHPYVGQFEDFVRAIRTGQPPLNDLASAAHSHEVAFAIEAAAQSGSVIRL
jgi:predicted dehydrogenase